MSMTCCGVPGPIVFGRVLALDVLAISDVVLPLEDVWLNLTAPVIGACAAATHRRTRVFRATEDDAARLPPRRRPRPLRETTTRRTRAAVGARAGRCFADKQ